jgi:hypothetical protein
MSDEELRFKIGEKLLGMMERDSCFHMHRYEAE